ncbi:MAG: plastocyanin/azurin family copper-binding protein [Chloroflexota bacterium]
MRHVGPVAAISLALVVVVAACSGSGSASGTPGVSEDPPTTTIEVTLRDTLQMEPNQMVVPAGEAITFVVTNDGVLDHEFFVGDESAQAGHAAEMATMGGMAHDESMGIGLRPGETKELIVTFATAGQVIAGCHVNGHYAGGMKAAIQVKP